MSFRVGQKVVCVDVGPNREGAVPTELVKGRVYTIAGLGYVDVDGDLGLYLHEVSASPRDDFSNAFKSGRFRPVVERKTDISVFTAMLTGSKIGASA